MNISIINGRIIDPYNQIDEILDLHIQDDKILGIGKVPPRFTVDKIIDAAGQYVFPGIIDMSTHLREPGQEYKANIDTETAAAAAGGITTLICNPDTSPVIDTPAVWELIKRCSERKKQARILAISALTQGLKGEHLSELATLKKSGCVGTSNGSQPIGNTLIERRALEYASTFDIPVILKPEDKHLKAEGCVHEGMVATRLGLPGIPTAAETVAVARDIVLAEHTGARIHFRTLSSASAARMLNDAKAANLAISADVAIHQLHLTEMDVDGFDSQCHVSPPLRTLADRDGLRAAINNGTIQVICSDHQPHENDAKLAPFPATETGISGLETLLPLTMKLVDEHVIDISTAIACLTSGPAKVLDLPYGRIDAGRIADICIYDPSIIWQLDKDKMKSRGHNTPFSGWQFNGAVSCTIFNGKIVYSRDKK